MHRFMLNAAKFFSCSKLLCMEMVVSITCGPLEKGRRSRGQSGPKGHIQHLRMTFIVCLSNKGFYSVRGVYPPCIPPSPRENEFLYHLCNIVITHTFYFSKVNDCLGTRLRICVSRYDFACGYRLRGYLDFSNVLIEALGCNLFE